MNGGYRPFDGDAWLGREIPLAGGPYRVLPESAFDVAEEMAFARQGRKARVFKLVGADGARYALKTFYRGFSLPEYGPITEALRAFSDIRGLRACDRRLVSEEEATAIGEPGLTYAVLMPWIEGVAWAGVVEARFPLPAEMCLALASQTASTLAHMEARHLTHADISSSNVLITSTDSTPAVELIDVEDMYHESFGPLPYVPDGSPGYAHPGNHGRGCRNPVGDRFAAAILLTEMLVWPDAAIQASIADVSVFDQNELGQAGKKYDLVREAVQARSPEAAALLERTWTSPDPASCPTLAEWSTALAGLDSSFVVPEPATDDGITAICPGCRRAVPVRRPSANHSAACPLRMPGSTPVPDKSSFPGVPTYSDIGFIPLFGDDLT